jgi:hypothetical protein
MVDIVVSTRIVVQASRHPVLVGMPSQNSAPKLLNPLPGCASNRDKSVDVQSEASGGVAVCCEGWNGGLSDRASSKRLPSWHDECVLCHAELVWDGEINHMQGSGVPIPANRPHRTNLLASFISSAVTSGVA